MHADNPLTTSHSTFIEQTAEEIVLSQGSTRLHIALGTVGVTVGALYLFFCGGVMIIVGFMINDVVHGRWKKNCKP